MGLDTDGRGFPHPQELAGRTAIVHCRDCSRLVGKDDRDPAIPAARLLTAFVFKAFVLVALVCPSCHPEARRIELPPKPAKPARPEASSSPRLTARPSKKRR